MAACVRGNMASEALEVFNSMRDPPGGAYDAQSDGNEREDISRSMWVAERDGFSYGSALTALERQRRWLDALDVLDHFASLQWAHDIFEGPRGGLVPRRSRSPRDQRRRRNTGEAKRNGNDTRPLGEVRQGHVVASGDPTPLRLPTKGFSISSNPPSTSSNASSDPRWRSVPTTPLSLPLLIMMDDVDAASHHDGGRKLLITCRDSLENIAHAGGDVVTSGGRPVVACSSLWPHVFLSPLRGKIPTTVTTTTNKHNNNNSMSVHVHMRIPVVLANTMLSALVKAQQWCLALHLYQQMEPSTRDRVTNFTIHDALLALDLELGSPSEVLAGTIPTLTPTATLQTPASAISPSLMAESTSEGGRDDEAREGPGGDGEEAARSLAVALEDMRCHARVLLGELRVSLKKRVLGTPSIPRGSETPASPSPPRFQWNTRDQVEVHVPTSRDRSSRQPAGWGHDADGGNDLYVAPTAEEKMLAKMKKEDDDYEEEQEGEEERAFDYVPHAMLPAHLAPVVVPLSSTPAPAPTPLVSVPSSARTLEEKLLERPSGR